MTYKNGIYLSVDGDNEEYERAKNRNYKRVERYENANGDSGVMRLTFNEYKVWLDKVGRMKSLYL